MQKLNSLIAAAAAALAVTLMVPAQASADAPNGTYFFDFDSLTVVTGGTDLSAFFPFAFLCDDFKTKSDGKLSGDCDVDIPGTQNGLKGKVKGDIDRNDDEIVLSQSLKLDGKIKGGGHSFDVDYDFDVKATLKAGDDEIKYKTKIKACVDNQCEKDSSTTKLPASSFGDFGVVTTDGLLELDVTTNNKNKIKGDARLTTTLGKKIKFDVKGKYDPVADTSIIKLAKKKSSIRLEDADVDGDIMTTTIIYKKIFGNRGSMEAMSVAPEM